MSSSSVSALIRAAQRGDVESVRRALNEGESDVNARAASSGNTALHEAAQRALLDVVRELLHAGAQVNAINLQGATPLHKALSRPSSSSSGDCSAVVHALLERGADVAVADRHGDNAIAKALRQNRVADLKLLLDALTDERLDAAWCAAPGALTLLHVAAVDSAAPDAIDLLLARFGAAKIDAPDAAHRSPLLFAGLKRDGRDFAKLEALRANWRTLVARGARLVDAAGLPLLQRGDISSEFAAFLLEQTLPSSGAAATALTAVGAHARALSIWPLQRIAATAEARAAVTADDADAMLSARADAADVSNETLLHALALEPEASDAAVLVVETIAKFRADALAEFAARVTRCSSRRTALHNAAMRGSLPVVRALLAALPQPGALLSARNAAGHTACDVAATHGRVDVWRALVERAGVPAAYPGDLTLLASHTADSAPLLVRAALANDVATVELLLRLGVDVGGENAALDEYSDESGTALHGAARRNETAPALAALLAHVATRDDRDALINKRAAGLQNQTPLHVAVDHGALECVRALLRHGADREARDAQERTAVDLAMMGTDERIAAALMEA